ncbi:hypothetical protein JL722_3131 [Aureococcus anophagefferens]|nr:hypothetical protein JL722_3131 [Aureococcus anophagefferens]
MGKGRGMLDGLRKSKKQKEAEKGAAAEKQERDQKRADEKVEEQTLSYQRHSDRPPNTLRITVIRAKDLQVMDGGMFSKGGSDPFPTCAVEGKKAKGTVKKKCLAPIWLEVFDLPAEDPDSVFTFQIDDHDLVGASDFMGLCRVRLGSLSDEKAHRKWHPLGNVKGEVDEIPRGEVELCLRWCHEKHRAYELPKEFKEGEKPLHEKEAANELHVLLIRARDLEKSTVKKKELNPVWQETFIFTCEDESATLHCTLDDYDPLSGNDFMGLASVPVRTLANRKIHRGWHKLGPAKGKDDKGKKRGRLEMALRWKHNPSLVIPLCAELLKPELNMMKPKNELEIFLIRGAGLKIMDKNLLSKGGSSDPLMKFELCGETATWLEYFALNCEEAGESFKATMEDYDLASGNDFMGVVSLSMSTLVDRRVRRQWFDLMDKGGKAPKESLGKVELALRWRHNPDKVLHLPEQMEADDDLQKTPNVLRICLVRAARGIKVMDKKLFGKGGSSDPFVTFSLDGEVRKSTVQKKSLRPTYFEMPCEDVDLSLLLTMEDYDLAGSNDFMGEVRVEIETFEDRELRRWWINLRGGPDRDEAAGSVEIACKWAHDPSNVLELPEEFVADEPPEHIASEANELLCILMRGKNLPIKDKNLLSKGGTSDPLCELNLDGVVHKSKCVKKNLNPLWMERFEFPCEDVEQALSLVVEDYDFVSGNDFMGQATIQLGHFPKIDEREVMRSWFQLAPRGVKLEPKQASDKKSRLLKRKKKNAKGGDADANLGRVEVALRWAMFGKGGTSDPFVVFECDGERTKSTVKKKDLNPPVDGELRAALRVVRRADSKGKLTVTVLDYDVMSEPDHMGHFELSFVALADRKVTRRWFGLRDAKKQKVGGKIECAFRWYHNPAFSITLPRDMLEEEAMLDMPPNQLRICLMRARELPVMDKALLGGGSSDPYAKVSLGEYCFKSEVKEKCLCPVWMERYDVPVDDVEGRVLDVALYDRDEGSKKKDDLMGKIKIPLKPTLQRVLLQRWHTLSNNERAAKREMEKMARRDEDEDERSHTDTKTGEVQVALRLVYNPKCRVSYYDLDDPADLERISEICVRAVEDQKDDPLKLLAGQHKRAKFPTSKAPISATFHSLLVVRCATCGHVLVDKTRRITPAMVAAARPAATLTMNLLYRLKCDLDQQDGAGRSAMHIAARYDSHAVVRVLAQLDGDVELADTYGKTPAHYAAEMGNEAALRTLSRLGAALDVETDNGKTCAALAAANGHNNMLLLLHSLGADVDQRALNFAGRTPLHFAAGNGHLQCARTLLRLGADINATDTALNTPVLHAALNGRKDVVEALEELECDMDHENSDGHDAKVLLALNFDQAKADEDLQSLGSYR